MTKILRAAGLVFFWIVATVVLLEISLQVLSVVFQSTQRSDQNEWSTGGVRILALGDSNTYGLYFDLEDSYPMQLNDVFREQQQSNIEVLNLGSPGTSTYTILDNIDEIMELMQPQVVLLMIGANDFWAQAIEADYDDGILFTATSFVRQNSKVFKLFSLVITNVRESKKGPIGQDEIVYPGQAETAHGRRSFSDSFTPEQMEEMKSKRGEASQEDNNLFAREVIKYMRKRPAGGPEVAGQKISLWQSERGQKPSIGRDIVDNIGLINQQIRKHGAGLVLVSYPSQKKTYGKASIEMDKAARKYDIPFIDIRPRLNEVCSDINCLDYLISDGHGNPRGYRIVAEEVSVNLRQLSETGRISLDE